MFTFQMLDDDMLHAQLARRSFELSGFIIAAEIVLGKRLRKPRWFVLPRIWLVVQTFIGGFLCKSFTHLLSRNSVLFSFTMHHRCTTIDSVGL